MNVLYYIHNKNVRTLVYEHYFFLLFPFGGKYIFFQLLFKESIIVVQ